MSATVLEKFRMPLGSLVVDAGLVLTLAFTAGQITSRLETMDRRLANVEVHESQDRVPERVAILEAKAVAAERDRTEILASLRRIEDSVASKQDKPR